MIVVRGTKKFLERVGTPGPACESSNRLGDWYVNILFWRPQVALFVNAHTLIPVLVPLAPANSVVARLPAAFDHVARHLGVGAVPLERELAAMADHVLAKTASRSVLGVMNEFAHMTDHARPGREFDLLELSLWLAQTPCGPLDAGLVSPDRALRAALG